MIDPKKLLKQQNLNELELARLSLMLTDIKLPENRLVDRTNKHQNASHTRNQWRQFSRAQLVLWLLRAMKIGEHWKALWRIIIILTKDFQPKIWPVKRLDLPNQDFKHLWILQWIWWMIKPKERLCKRLLIRTWSASNSLLCRGKNKNLVSRKHQKCLRLIFLSQRYRPSVPLRMKTCPMKANVKQRKL